MRPAALRTRTGRLRGCSKRAPSPLPPPHPRRRIRGAQALFHARSCDDKVCSARAGARGWRPQSPAPPCKPYPPPPPPARRCRAPVGPCSCRRPADAPRVHRRPALVVAPGFPLAGAGKVRGPVASCRGRDRPLSPLPHGPVRPKQGRNTAGSSVPPHRCPVGCASPALRRRDRLLALSPLPSRSPLPPSTMQAANSPAGRPRQEGDGSASTIRG